LEEEEEEEEEVKVGASFCNLIEKLWRIESINSSSRSTE
jgi:hypothetical protein